jgi:hypothetical protein
MKALAKDDGNALYYGELTSERRDGEYVFRVGAGRLVRVSVRDLCA